jgi:hypothetical protein
MIEGSRPLAFLALCAALCATALPAPAWAAGVAVDEATEAQKQDARQVFVEARKAYDERRFQDAIGGFRASYHIVASPNTRVMVAHTLRELGRYAEAHHEFERAVEEAEVASKSEPKYAESANKARKKRDALLPKIGLLEVVVQGADDEAVLRVAGQEVPQSRWGKAVAVEPGQVTVTLSMGADSLVREVSAEAGKSVRVTIGSGQTGGEEEPAGPPSDGSLQRTFAFVAAGVGAAAFLTAGVFGTLALVKHNELEDECDGHPCGERRDDIEQGRTYQTVTNVMVVVGAVAMSAGVVLYFTSPSGPPTEAATALTLSLGPGSLSLGGRF